MSDDGIKSGLEGEANSSVQAYRRIGVYRPCVIVSLLINSLNQENLPASS